jgi:translation initiation factor 2B subunit (eIF-2B alpha/beta/delta family)
MVVGASIAFEQFFKIISEKEGYDLTVIVVDTCPSFSGRGLVQLLSNFNVKCKYTLLNGIGCLIS